MHIVNLRVVLVRGVALAFGLVDAAVFFRHVAIGLMGWVGFVLLPFLVTGGVWATRSNECFKSLLRKVQQVVGEVLRVLERVFFHAFVSVGLLSLCALGFALGLESRQASSHVD